MDHNVVNEPGDDVRCMVRGFYIMSAVYPDVFINYYNLYYSFSRIYSSFNVL